LIGALFRLGSQGTLVPERLFAAYH